MISQVNLKTVLKSVAGAALIAGLALSPLSASGALANSPDSHENGSSDGMGSGMNQNENSSEQEMRNELENGMGAPMNSGMNNSDEDEDHRNDRSNSRPMNLDDFLTSLRNGATIISAERDGNEIEIEYSDGWKEQIEHGRYEIEAPNGRTIISRPATQRDFDRLNSAF